MRSGEIHCLSRCASRPNAFCRTTVVSMTVLDAGFRVIGGATYHPSKCKVHPCVSRHVYSNKKRVDTRLASMI